MTEVDPWLGKTLNNSIQIHQRLGEGGMALIYLGRHLASDKRVVVKIPRAEMLHDSSFVARFKREIDALIKLAHPSIVKILAHGQADHTPYAVLRYLEGGSLNARHPRDAGGKTLAVDPRRLADWLPGVASALDFIHANNYLHRDVKPDNILFDDKGKTYLTDFGIAKVAADARPAEQQTVHTKLGMVVGTLQTMAPEVILGRPSDGRLDQYALAVTVFQQLTGRFPFDDPTSTKILVQHVSESPSGLDSHVPHLPRELTAVVHRGLAKDPAQRFPTCTAFADATLEAVWDMARGKAAPTSAPPRPAPRQSLPTAMALPVRGRGETVIVPMAPSPEPVPVGENDRFADPVTGWAVPTEAVAQPVAIDYDEAPPARRRRIDEQSLESIPPYSQDRPAREGFPIGARVGVWVVFLFGVIGTILWAMREHPRDSPRPKPPARLTRAADVRLVAGERATMTVRVERRGWSGDLNVSVAGLPPGLSIDPGNLLNGRETVVLTIVSTRQTKAGPFQATLSLMNGGVLVDQQEFVGKVMEAEPPPAAPPNAPPPATEEKPPPAVAKEEPNPVPPMPAPNPPPRRLVAPLVFRDHFQESKQVWGIETVPAMGIVSRRLPGLLSFSARNGGNRWYSVPCPEFTAGTVMMTGTIKAGSAGAWGIAIVNQKNRRGVQVTVDQAGLARVGPWVYDADPKLGPRAVAARLGNPAGSPNALRLVVSGQVLSATINGKRIDGIEPIRGNFTPGSVIFQTAGRGPLAVDLLRVYVWGPPAPAP